MIYGLGMMYQLLDKYVENSMGEAEYAFIPDLKWPDSRVLEIRDDRFWEGLRDSYDILFSDKEKKEIVTIGDLKQKICLEN